MAGETEYELLDTTQGEYDVNTRLGVLNVVLLAVGTELVKSNLVSEEDFKAAMERMLPATVDVLTGKRALAVAKKPTVH